MILLKIETKTELLKYTLLKYQFDYDLILYTLISRNNMQDVISIVDEKTFYFKVDAATGTISAKQLIVNLSQFIKVMKKYFFNIAPLESCISEVVDSNINELKKLVSHNCSNHFDGEEDDTFKEIVAKIIIKNFINNAKYIDAIKNVLEDIHVPLKAIEEYSLEESQKILTLLSSIAFCQRGQSPVTRLFVSMDNQFKRYDSMDASRKKSAVRFKNKFSGSCINDYEKIIKNYYSKKKYLKYFM